jgi:hypothetical protein
MELNKLAPFVLMLVAIGVLVGISMIVTDKIGTAGRWTNVYVYNDSFVVTNATNVNFDHGNITSFVQIHNATNSVLGAGNYTLNLLVGNATMILYGTGANSTCKTDGATLCYADYYYTEYNTPTATAMGSVTSEVGGISTTWLSIVVICVVAALILALVMGNFQNKR